MGDKLPEGMQGALAADLTKFSERGTLTFGIEGVEFRVWPISIGMAASYMATLQFSPASELSSIS
jgi:hypothetical protein